MNYMLISKNSKSSPINLKNLLLELMFESNYSFQTNSFLIEKIIMTILQYSI